MRPKAKIDFEKSKYFQVKRGKYKFLELYRLGLLDGKVMRDFDIVDTIYRQYDAHPITELIRQQARKHKLTKATVQHIWYTWTTRY